MSALHDQIDNSVDLHAPVRRVWRAVTNFREFGDWFGVKLESPFVVGKVSKGSITYPGYEHLKWEAVIQRMLTDSLFVFTWHPYAVDPDKDYSMESSTTVTFRLKSSAAGCQLAVAESGFGRLPAGRRAEAYERNSEGWTIQMKNIAGYLHSNP